MEFGEMRCVIDDNLPQQDNQAIGARNFNDS